MLGDNFHLAEIAKIIKKWTAKEKMLECYTTISGTVSAESNIHKPYLNVDQDLGWDNLTKAQIKDKGRELYALISKYMTKNNVNTSLVITNASRRSWANNGLEIYFLRQLHVSL